MPIATYTGKFMFAVDPIVALYHEIRKFIVNMPTDPVAILKYVIVRSSLSRALLPLGAIDIGPGRVMGQLGNAKEND